MFRFASALLLVVSLAVPSAAQIAPTAKLSHISIGNFGRINDHYYRGAQPRARDYADLAALGVRTVIDLTGGSEADLGEQRMVEQAGMTFYRIPMSTSARPSGADVATFLKLVNDAVNQPVFVHCQGGRHRTGTMTAVYRMTQDGWSADRAYSEMQQYRFGPAFLHSTLKAFVYDYYGQIQARAVKPPPVLATQIAR